MFIAFEGIDGSGKTTQAQRLFETIRSRGIRCELTSEPTDGPIGRMIRSALKKEIKLDNRTIQLLFCADRSHHVNSLIEPKTKQGVQVITDRYFFSTIAYGAAGGIDREWLKSANSRFPLPDITFILEIDPEKAMARIGARVDSGKTGAADPKVKHVEIFEKLDFQKRVRDEYRKIASEYRNVHLIDSSKEIDIINKEISTLYDIRAASIV
jgi:dTMP kinase